MPPTPYDREALLVADLFWLSGWDTDLTYRPLFDGVDSRPDDDTPTNPQSEYCSACKHTSSLISIILANEKLKVYALCRPIHTCMDLEERKSRSLCRELRRG